MLSAAEQQYIAQGIIQNLRSDGRSSQEFRPIEVELGLVAQASGSARLRLGSTDVLVGVKVEIGQPDRETPDFGQVFVSVECSSVASPEFQGRGGEEWGADMAHALTAALLPVPSGKGGGLDLSSLSIISGKRCWMLYVDALVLNNGGNVLGAVSLAAAAALSNTRIPRVAVVPDEEGGEPEIDLLDDGEDGVALDTSQLPVVLSVSMVGPACCVDLDADEESCAETTCHVAVNVRGEVCGITQEGRRGAHPGTVQAMVETAQRLGPPAIKQLAAFCQAHEAARRVRED